MQRLSRFRKERQTWTREKLGKKKIEKENLIIELDIDRREVCNIGDSEAAFLKLSTNGRRR